MHHLYFIVRALCHLDLRGIVSSLASTIPGKPKATPLLLPAAGPAELCGVRV